MEDVGLWRVLDYGGCSTTEVLDNRSVGLQRCLLTEVLDYGGCWMMEDVGYYGGCWIMEDVGLRRMLDYGGCWIMEYVHTLHTHPTHHTFPWTVSCSYSDIPPHTPGAEVAIGRHQWSRVLW